MEAELALKTISKYGVVLSQAADTLDEAGLNCYPRKIGKVEINYLRKNCFVENSESYNGWKLAIVGEWLAWYDNKIVEKMKIPWPQEDRINVDWLEPEEAIQMKKAAQGIEKLIVHLMLDLGLRRIDMYPLPLSSIHQGFF